MNWAHVKAVFAEAVEVDAVARDQLVHARCAGDMALEEEVFSLLAAHDRESGLASRSGSTTSGVFEAAAGQLGLATERPGSQVGAYLLEELIGEGGFGSVFRAVQQRPVKREVALKVIKLGMDTREVVARFELERQTLALMDHAGIARVFDAGATTTGRPYFVMELVRGEPITAFCNRHRLGIAERVRLVREIALAVQHAHSKGIIHRDLKPSNILVSSVDGSPAAKVIDFGIAKATVASAGAFHTEQRAFVGTPEYMAPEQADLTAADIDIRTDVYALGTLLYELLAGQTPFDALRLRRAGVAEVQRILREEEPLPPSTRLSRRSTPSQTASTAGSANNAQPAAALVPLAAVPRDLDWVVMKCLEKDRTRRYESASAFAADLARFLDGQPVAAAPPSVRYRLSKFIARRRTLVTAVIVTSVAILTGFGIAAGALVKAASAGRVAQSEATKALAVERFMVSMLGRGDLTNTDGRDLPMSEVLDEATRDIERGELASQPLVEATVRLTLARAYLSISRLDKASAHAHESVRLRRLLLGPDHLDVAESLRAEAFISTTGGDQTECIPLMTEAVRIMERDPDHAPELASTYVMLGSHLFSLRHNDDARAAFQRAIDICTVRKGPDAVETLIARTKLAIIAHDPAAGLQVVQRAVAILEADRPVNSTVLASTLSDLGGLQQMQGDFAGSIATYQRSLDLYVAVYGESNQHSLEIMNRLVWTYDMAGNGPAAKDMARRTMEVARRTIPRDGNRYYGYLMSALRTHLNFGVDPDGLDLAAECISFAPRLFNTTSNQLFAHFVTIESAITAGRLDAAADQITNQGEPLLVRLTADFAAGTQNHLRSTSDPAASARFHLRWLRGRLLEAQGRRSDAIAELTPVADALMDDARAIVRIRFDVLDRLALLHRGMAEEASLGDDAAEHTGQADRYAAKAAAIRAALAR